MTAHQDAEAREADRGFDVVGESNFALTESSEAEQLGQRVLTLKRAIDERRQLLLGLERRYLAIEEEKRVINRELRRLWEEMRSFVGLSD